ncbi:4-deoxy-L-threo-5-hexosulose-uronate ketol-isomerase [Enterobacteriaceae bacterium A-F18]|nr:4-deoxy-L-threo-5-hexosulose-uronate ketol-isomerase [Enterobacteriaceae bacterium ENNIH3]AUV07311.1 4-deoxy-L-threo-5-hexosulose-uronate ketol-isomerase [Enterobacteriaceae bacterium ENNIH2]PTA94105.1 4-deoxy-L-threo-5-hexosulose-uronate ketol-isomerase [Kluyvera sp. Nf5]PWF53886.1 4-deoxy-L-threo-5-hexosulose-uronate ketol-isomerase [[Kluyvera] intestini]QIH62033.1 4-deoxy-L-threo-5-hexosulose-uronate ketol-isomerase [Enterobacteriaceae bacterium A-F18]
MIATTVLEIYYEKNETLFYITLKTCFSRDKMCPYCKTERFLFAPLRAIRMKH